MDFVIGTMAENKETSQLDKSVVMPIPGVQKILGPVDVALN